MASRQITLSFPCIPIPPSSMSPSAIPLSSSAPSTASSVLAAKASPHTVRTYLPGLHHRPYLGLPFSVPLAVLNILLPPPFQVDVISRSFLSPIYTLPVYIRLSTHSVSMPPRLWRIAVSLVWRSWCQQGLLVRYCIIFLFSFSRVRIMSRLTLP